MQLLDRIWEGTNSFFNGVMSGVGRGLTEFFGTSNARTIRRHQESAVAINALEPKIMALSDSELREETAKLKARLAAGEALDDILIQAFAYAARADVVSEDAPLRCAVDWWHGTSWRQHCRNGKREGKTLVATLPAFILMLSKAAEFTSLRLTITWLVAIWNGWLRSIWG